MADIYIKIRPSTYRGLHRVSKMMGLDEKKFTDKALRTFIGDNYDAITADKAMKKWKKSGCKTYTTQKVFGDTQ